MKRWGKGGFYWLGYPGEGGMEVNLVGEGGRGDYTKYRKDIFLEAI